MPLHTIILAGVAIFAGVLLQGAVGFGMGLFSIPVLLWLGVDLPVAVAVLTVATLVQSLYGAVIYRQHIPWRAVAQTTPLRLVFVVLGVWLLWHIDSLPRHTIKQIVGCAILAIIIAQLALRIQPRPSIPIAWAWLAGALGGLMAGAIGMGGPPIIFWAMAHDWPNRTTRSFLWISFGLLSPVTIIALLATFGSPIGHALLVGLAITPMTILGVRLGMRLGERLNRQRLRFATLVLLSLIALGAILDPFLSPAQPPANPPAKTSLPSPSPDTTPSFGPGDSPAPR